jgi:hypothetical protein
MSAQAPGSPHEGSIWIVCDLRVASDAQVAAFEQRVLGARDSLWESFWTTPPLRPCWATFELSEAAYQANRAAIDKWIREQPELSNPRVETPLPA